MVVETSSGKSGFGRGVMWPVGRWRRKSVWLLCVAGFLVGACGQGAAVSEPQLVADSTDEQATASTDLANEVEVGQPFDSQALVFYVDGAEVITETFNGSLPESAGSRLEMTTLVIATEPSQGVACRGGFAKESLPPQCVSSLPLSSLNAQDLPEEYKGQFYGSVTLDLVMEDGVGVVQQVRPPQDPWIYWEQTPTECEGVPVSGSEAFAVVGKYSEELGSQAGKAYQSADNVLVLEVLEDRDVHVQALAAAGVVDACVVVVDRSMQQVRELLDQLRASPVKRSIARIETGAGGRVNVFVDFADQQTVRSFLNEVDDPTSIRIIGLSKI